MTPNGRPNPNRPDMPDSQGARAAGDAGPSPRPSHDPDPAPDPASQRGAANFGRIGGFSSLFKGACLPTKDGDPSALPAAPLQFLGAPQSALAHPGAVFSTDSPGSPSGTAGRLERPAAAVPPRGELGEDWAGLRKELREELQQQRAAISELAASQARSSDELMQTKLEALRQHVERLEELLQEHLSRASLTAPRERAELAELAEAAPRKAPCRDTGVQVAMAVAPAPAPAPAPQAKEDEGTLGHVDDELSRLGNYYKKRLDELQQQQEKYMRELAPVAEAAREQKEHSLRVQELLEELMLRPSRWRKQMRGGDAVAAANSCPAKTEMSMDVSDGLARRSSLGSLKALPPMAGLQRAPTSALEHEDTEELSLQVQETRSSSAILDVTALQAAQGWGQWKQVQRTEGAALNVESSRSTISYAHAHPVAHFLERRLQFLSTCLVLANVIFMGVEVEVAMHHVVTNTPTPTWLWWTDFGFAVCFITELVLRLLLTRTRFFFGPDWRWNMFDSIIVASTVMDLLSSFMNVAFMRSLRAIRAVRAARIIRTIRYVRELRLMVASILSSLVSLAWAFVFLAFVLYLFSIIIMQVLETHLESTTHGELDQEIVDSYGSVQTSMLALFMAISGGRDWHDLLNPLRNISEWYCLVFIFYITFVVFGVLNILTAIFVESANKISEIDRDLVIQDEIQRNNSTMNSMRRIFYSMDDSNSGQLNREKLEEVLKDPETRAHLKILGLDVSETRGLFQLLDIDEQEMVSIEEFVLGMMRLKGAAKGVDIATVMYENKRIVVRLTAFMRYVEDNFRMFFQSLDYVEAPEDTSSKRQTLREYVTTELHSTKNITTNIANF